MLSQETFLQLCRNWIVCQVGCIQNGFLTVFVNKLNASPGKIFPDLFFPFLPPLSRQRQWTLVGWKSRKKLSRIVLHIFWWYRIKYGFVFRLVDLIPRFLLTCFNINNIPYCCILSFLSGEENQSIENSFTIILNVIGIIV